MSTRHLARLRAQGPAGAADATADPEHSSGSESDDASGSDHEQRVKAPVRNVFAMLSDSSSDDEDESAQWTPSSAPSSGAPAPTSAGSSSKSKKAAKKKGGGKKKGGSNNATTGAAGGTATTAAEAERYVASAVKAALQAPVGLLPPDLLVVKKVGLNFLNEMKRHFGAATVTNDEGAGEAKAAASEDRRRRGPRALPRGFRMPPGKKNMITVTPNPDWGVPPPKPSGGLGMILSSEKPTVSTNPRALSNLCSGGQSRAFQYQFSDYYAQVQMHYQECVASFDPNTIANLWHRNPFHVDSMLQLSEFYRATGQYEDAAGFLRRALFVLECGWHPLFKPWEYPCYLDFSTSENRSLFTVLFRHIQLLGRAGCVFTAFETSKLLLQLDPAVDPMRILLCIDFFAIRSEHYDFVQQLTRATFEDGTSVTSLPNLAFSRALALRKLGASAAEAAAAARGPKFDVRDDMHAERCLLRAILTFPSAIPALQQQCRDKDDEEKGDDGWAAILEHPFFTSAAVPSVLERLINVFVVRSAGLWKTPELQMWLQKACLFACGAHDAVMSGLAMDTTVDEDKYGCFRTPAAAAEAALAAQHARNAAYGGAGIERIRHYGGAILSDFADTVTAVTTDELARMEAADAPAGIPIDAEDEAAIRAMEARIADNRTALPADTNALLLFLQTLLPWNRVAGTEGGDAAAAAAAGVDPATAAAIAAAMAEEGYEDDEGDEEWDVPE